MRFSQTDCGCLLFTMVLTTLVTSTEASNPNVLLICVDDLKPTIGCFGDSYAKTPNIDRLAARGVTFDSAYCNQAVCSPSRNALLTGLRPQTLGIYDLPTNFRNAAPDAITLSQYFRQYGYSTQALGKVFHVGHGNIDDIASWDVPLFRPKSPTYATTTKPEQRVDKQGQVRGQVTESEDVDDDTYADGAVATEAIKRLNIAAVKQQPFLIAVGFVRPHLPFVSPRKYWDQYDQNQIPMPEFIDLPQFAPQYAPTQFGELRTYAGVPENGVIDSELTRHLIHGYYAATSYTDAQVGRLLDALDASPAANNTIIVFWGDHGWHLGDHGMWCKHSNYEQATRIPVIISAPAMSQGVHTKSMIESVDIYPTLAELAGLKNPQSVDGQSFASVLKSPATPAREYVTHVYPRGDRLGRAIRTERYRMVEWRRFADANDEAEFELYDYQTDPLETKNLAVEKPEILNQIKAILVTHPAPKPQWVASPNAKSAIVKPGNDRAAMFERRDKNNDNSLTMEEFMTNQPDPENAKKRFPKFDKNSDDVLSPAEFIGNP